jgi:hypothetical protein
MCQSAYQCAYQSAEYKHMREKCILSLKTCFFKGLQMCQRAYQCAYQSAEGLMKCAISVGMSSNRT